MNINLQLLAANAGQALMKCLTPMTSALLLLAFIIFAMGFALTLVATLKVQWGHQAGEARYITTGVIMILIGIIIVIFY